MKNEGTKLLRMRQQAGMRQVELAAKAGVSVGVLNRAERWGFPVAPDTAEKLARVLNCEASDITEGGAR